MQVTNVHLHAWMVPPTEHFLRILLASTMVAISGSQIVEGAEAPASESPKMPAAAEVSPAPAPARPSPALSIAATEPESKNGPVATTPELDLRIPPGVFFLKAAARIETESGVIGLRQGTRVIKQPNGKYREPGGHLLSLKPHEVTNDPRIARQLIEADSAAQAALLKMQQAALANVEPTSAKAPPVAPKAEAPSPAPAPPPLSGAPVEIAPDGAWTWFNDERTIFHQGSLFCGYVKANGQYGITRRDLASGTNHHTIITSRASQQQDDHNNPSLTVLPDGRLMALYSKHISGEHFFQRTSLVKTPSSLDDWGPEITRSMPANNTYCNTYRLTGESNAIYNFSRCINFNPTLTISTDAGRTWGTPRQLIRTGTGGTRPYPRYTSNGIDRIDCIYTDGHPRNSSNSVYHLYYKRGGLYRTNGTLLDSLAKIPLNHDGGERGSVIYQYSDAKWGPGKGPNDWIPSGRGWTWDVAYARNGSPVAVFQVQRDDVTGTGWSNDRIYYYYAFWTGTTWQRRFIAHAGRPLYAAEDDYGGGMCLDPDDPRIVYISTNAADPFKLSNIDDVPLRASARYEIYRGFTADNGLTFTWTPVTENSTADNLRPIVPPNHPHTMDLVWFCGTYTTYTDFSTRVLALFGAPRSPSPQ